MSSDLDRVADELYARLPGDFIAERDARAAEAKKAGDRALATAIKALRRPTVAAWLANWLARQEAEQLGRLLDLGAAMRSAQDHLDGDQLRQLSRQRHQVVAALGGQARRAAFEAGLTVGEGALRELEVALNAALADDEAADLLRAGRLTTAGQHAGFGPADAVTAVQPSPPAPSKRGDKGAQPDRAKGDDKRRQDREAAAEGERQQAAAEHRRQIEAAEQAVADAQTSVAAARRQAEAQRRLVAEARSRHEQMRQSIRDLEAQLNELREAEAEAAANLEQAEESKAGAEHVTEAAEGLLDDVRGRLDRLHSA